MHKSVDNYSPPWYHIIMSKCVKCSDIFNKKRLELGYNTCLGCGDLNAAAEIVRKSHSVAPAFNKGPYTYVYSKNQAKSIGR